ncbi:hypothetical protein HDU93_007762 [Gonapodya sp. JEL0774]|nr:hypothetical protein HDU93_007762 [Gonapodya sp. JEL0774]
MSILTAKDELDYLERPARFITDFIERKTGMAIVAVPRELELWRASPYMTAQQIAQHLRFPMVTTNY